jgi:hypothetical protein
MSPKEKANELFDKYYIICQEFTEEIQCSIQAKQCALIAVDEILFEASDEDDISWFKKVKQEIELL